MARFAKSSKCSDQQIAGSGEYIASPSTQNTLVCVHRTPGQHGCHHTNHHRRHLGHCLHQRHHRRQHSTTGQDSQRSSVSEEISADVLEEIPSASTNNNRNTIY